MAWLDKIQRQVTAHRQSLLVVGCTGNGVCGFGCTGGELLSSSLGHKTNQGLAMKLSDKHNEILVGAGIVMVLLIVGSFAYKNVGNKVYCSPSADIVVRNDKLNEDGNLEISTRNSSAVASFSYQKENVFNKDQLAEYGNGCKDFSQLGFYEKWQRFIGQFNLGN